MKTISIRRDEDKDREVTCFLVNDVDTLLYIANLGCIPIHILAARSKELTLCDFITFDFDIGSSPIAHAVELALSLRGLLTDLGLVGYPEDVGAIGSARAGAHGPRCDVHDRQGAGRIGRALARGPTPQDWHDGANHQTAQQPRLHRHRPNRPFAHHRRAVLGARAQGSHGVDAARVG